MFLVSIIKTSPVIFYLLLLNASAFAEAGRHSEIYSFPISELEYVISDWLSISGYKVQRHAAEMGAMKLFAVKSSERWQVILRPHSALATEVQTKPQNDTGNRTDLPQRLSEHLTSYDHKQENGQHKPRQPIPPEIVSQIGSAVCIEAKFPNSQVQVSGFIFDRKGLILCTTHNLQNLSTMKVTLHNGRKLDGRLIKIDLEKDLALIQINSAVENYIHLTEGRNQISIGEQIFSIGCPINTIGTIYSGIINGPPRRVGQMPFLQVHMDIYPGSSGSPVFDGQGRLIGMVKGRYRGTSSIGFVIPLETILSFLNES